MRLNVLYDGFIDSLKNVKTSPWLFMLSMILDFGFLMMYFLASSFGFRAILPRIEVIATALQESPELLTGSMETGALNIPLEAFSTVKSMFWEIVLIFLVYLAALYVIFLLFEGSNWYIANRISHKHDRSRHRAGYWKHLLRFFTVSGIYYLVLMLIVFLSLRQSIVSMFMQETIINVLLVASISIVAFFMLISISLLEKHGFTKAFSGTFKVAFRRFPIVILSYIIVFLMFFVVDLLLRLFELIPGIPFWLWFTLSALLFTIAVGISRIYLIRVFNDADDHVKK